MSIAGVAAVVKALREHPVLEPAQLEEVRRTLQVSCTEPAALVRELVRRGWLTPYQAGLLGKGRAAELVLGSYVLLEPLGEGGMGQVFRARQRELGRIDAVKVVRAERLGSPDALQRFRREMRAAAALSHANVVHAFDAGEESGRHYIAMELLGGQDLSQLVKTGGPLPFAEACEYARQAALGLQHAHEMGLVHRDIKPSNLLLTPGGVVKVLDLGLARLTQQGDQTEGTLTADGVVMGTPDYLAPEQARQAHEVDARADLYSLGCTLYFLLAGRPPFPGRPLAAKIAAHLFEEPESLEQLRPGTPPSVSAVVRRLSAKKPEDRYPTAGEAAAALGRVLAGLAGGADAATGAWTTGSAPTVADPPMRANAARRPAGAASRRRLLAYAGATGVLLVAAAVLVWLLVAVLAPHKPEPTPPGSPPPLQTSQPKSLDNEYVNSLKMRLVRVAPGKFVMGSPFYETGRNADEGPRHDVDITRPFYMGACPVTQEEYERVTGKTPSTFNRPGAVTPLGGGAGVRQPLNTDRCPVESVSWDEAAAFCATLNRQDTGRPAGWDYDLPTEAEWEYACRAGTETAYSFGGNATALGEYAWYSDNSGGRTHEVGDRKPNAWGLYDMHGNVWQWCADWYGKYSEGPVKDPTGPKSGLFRVMRGGSWGVVPGYCRSANRGANAPGQRTSVVGFRVVMRGPGK